jgi:hypothetical protein
VEVGVVESLVARYIPKWLRLAGGPAFIGASDDDGRIDICNAIDDGEVLFRATVDASNADYGGRVFEGYRYGGPKHLHPDDLDWERSCPREPWNVHGSVGTRLLPIGLLELSTDDLVRVFGKPQAGDVTRTEAAAPAPPASKPDDAVSRGDPPVTAEQFKLAEKVLPLLVEWAEWKYSGRVLPSRGTLLKDHRGDYGDIRGISVSAMRGVRAKLATAEQKRGGAPTQKRFMERSKASNSKTA